MLGIVVTGKWTIPASEMAEIILNAVGEFSIEHKPTFLGLVRITIFQPKMVDDFARAVAKKIDEKNSRGILSRMKGALPIRPSVCTSVTLLLILHTYAVASIPPKFLEQVP